MARKPTLTDDDASALTDAELAEMRPARDVLSAEEFAAVTSVRKALCGRPPPPWLPRRCRASCRGRYPRCGSAEEILRNLFGLIVSDGNKIKQDDMAIIEELFGGLQSEINRLQQVENNTKPNS